MYTCIYKECSTDVSDELMLIKNIIYYMYLAIRIRDILYNNRGVVERILRRYLQWRIHRMDTFMLLFKTSFPVGDFLFLNVF